MFRFFINLFLITSFPFFLNFAQKSSDISVLISANLTGERYIQLPGNLNFDNISLTQSAMVISRDPDKGIKVKIVGRPDKNIILTYSPIKINNFQWASENDSNKGTISFTPKIKCSLENTLQSKSVSVKSGSSSKLSDLDGDGIAYVWIGGEIKITANQPRGDYYGIFQIKVAYE